MKKKATVLVILAFAAAAGTMTILRWQRPKPEVDEPNKTETSQKQESEDIKQSEQSDITLPDLRNVLEQLRTVAHNTTDYIVDLMAQKEAEEARAQAAANINTSTNKIFTYSILVWGTVEADVADFRLKVAETLNDQRGWARAGWQFVEIADSSQAMFDIILSDPAHLEALNGCSGELSCTTWNNQVIINDVRWRFGTAASQAAGMSTRDYQHMVVNHEVGHWLGHYSHVESCPNGGPAPIMLQQSTGLRGCDSFNPWPLDWELWTNK